MRNTRKGSLKNKQLPLLSSQKDFDNYLTDVIKHNRPSTPKKSGYKDFEHHLSKRKEESLFFKIQMFFLGK